MLLPKKRKNNLRNQSINQMYLIEELSKDNCDCYGCRNDNRIVPFSHGR